MNLQTQNQNLISISELIRRAQEAGFDFGKGNPVNRLRYYTKNGLIPHAQRKQALPGESFTIGYYPDYTLDLLLKIQGLKKSGQTAEKIAAHMAVEKMRAAIKTVGGVGGLGGLGGVGRKNKIAIACWVVAVAVAGFLFWDKSHETNVTHETNEVLGENTTQPVPAALLSQPVALYTSANLLQNPGFEAGPAPVKALAGFQPNGWQYLGNSGSFNTFVSNYSVRSGSLGLLFQGSQGSQGVYQQQTKTINGRDYTLSLWLRSEKPATLRLGFLGGADQNDPNYNLMSPTEWKDYAKDAYQEFSLKGDGAWQQFSYTYKNAALGKIPYVQVSGLSDGDRVFVDDVALIENSSNLSNSSNLTNLSNLAFNINKIGNNSVIVDDQGHIYPEEHMGAGSLGMANHAFGALYLSQATIDGNGNLSANGTITAGGNLTANANLTVKGTASFEQSASISGSLRVYQALTANGFTNTGSTLFEVLTVADLASGGSVGTAGNTVDKYSTIAINQTTGSQTITLPTPSSTTAGRMVFVTNTGTAPFTILSTTLLTGSTLTAVWNGTSWTTALGTGLVVGTVNNSILRWNTATAQWLENANIIAAAAGNLGVVGNVGIGTTTPAYNLEIAQASGIFNFSSSTGVKQIQTGGTTNLALMPGGNLGIGTTSPTAKLEVNGDLLVNTYATVSASLGIGTSAAAGPGNLNMLNNLTVGGSTVLGTSTTNNLTVNSYITSNLVPNPGSQYDLGSTTRHWNNVYADTVTATNLSGTVITGNTSSNDWWIGSGYTGPDAQDITITFERGSPAVNAELRWNSTSKWLSTNVPSFVITADSGITYSGKAALIVNQIQSQDIFTASASGTPKFVISNGGNVGIGTTAPTQALTVSANAVIGSSTANAETLANTGFVMGGDDLFVAGMAGIEGNVYTDSSFIAGASTTYGNGSLTQSASEQFSIKQSTNTYLDISTTGNLSLGNTAGTSAITSSDWAISTSGVMTGIGAITMDGNFSQTGTTTFSTGTGAVSLNGTVTMPTPFTLGATSVTSTGTQLNYLNAATSTTGTVTTNLVFSTSPTLITPALGTPTALVLTNATGLPAASVLAGTFGTGAYTMDTSLTNPLLIGGTAVGSSLTLKSTSGVGSTDFIKFLVGNNGATEAMRIDTSGNVGIGTTGPGAKLDVQISGNDAIARFVGTSSTLGSWISTVQGSTIRTYLGHQNSTGGGIVTSGIASAGVFRADAGIHLTVGSSATIGITIDVSGNVGIGTITPGTAGLAIMNGNVGIGTTGPGASLDILTSSGNVQLKLQYSGFDSYAFRREAGTGLGIYNTTDSRNEMFFDSAGGVGIGGNITTAGFTGASVVINSAGNVGIGTTGPGALLHLAGSGTDTTSSNGQNLGSSMILQNTSNTTNNYSAIYWKDDSGTGVGAIGLQYTDQTNGYGDLYFITRSASGYREKVRITSAGNVGIGTTGPAYKLDVAGDINTTGDVRKNGTAYTNPDYVFYPTYNLMDLADLKTYTATNFHLPGVPSSEDIARDGVRLFEQTRLNLEKTEEAYLYIFKLNDQVASQSAEISRLDSAQASSEARLANLPEDISPQLALIPQIKSDIALLKEQMASVSGQLAKTQTDVATVSAQLVLQGLTSPLQGETFINVDTLSAQFANFSDSLKVIGKTQLAETSIGGALQVGFLHFDDLKAEISSLTGTVSILGDATVSGKLRVENGLILKDKTTGDDYCVQINNGEIIKNKGVCN